MSDIRAKYGMPMRTASFSDADLKRLDELAAERLREKGYFVLTPGDTSPVAELLRAVVGHYAGKLGIESICWCISGVAKDPSVIQWIERGWK